MEGLGELRGASHASTLSPPSLSTEPFIPWRRTTLLKHAPTLGILLKSAFYPATPEEAFDHRPLNSAYETLQASSGCRICRLLCHLVSVREPGDQFFEDYAHLCLACLYAPVTWSSAAMATADLLEILQRHFDGTEEATPPATTMLLQGDPDPILGPDIQLHFFIQRCFKQATNSNAYLHANLSFLKLEFLRSNITGKLSTQLCFRTYWNNILRKGESQDRDGDSTDVGCCERNRGARPKKDPRDDQSSGAASLHHLLLESDHRHDRANNEETVAGHRPTRRHKPSLLDFFIASWLDSSLFARRRERATRLLETPQAQDRLPPLEYEEKDDQSQGPCLFCPTFALKEKNKTFSICLLCEALACHPEGKHACDLIAREVLNCTHNNMKLLDRIAYVKTTEEFLGDVQDPALREFMQACSIQEIFKHLFADPLCLLNNLITNSAILFDLSPADLSCRERQRLILGDYLKFNSQFDCEHVLTLALAFKGLQHFKVQKTTFLEIVRELDSLLEAHGIRSVQSTQTVQLFT